MLTPSHIETTQTQLRNWPGKAPKERLAATLAAAIATSAIGAALLSVFHFASSAEWLIATPQVLEEVHRCERFADRFEQTACKQRFVTAQLSKSPDTVLVAGR